MIPPITFIHNTPSVVVVKVDVTHVETSASAPMGKRVKLPDGSVAININYFWNSKPIGALIEKGKPLSTIPLNYPRAVLIIKDKKAEIHVITPEEVEYHLQKKEWTNATVVQAGPRLIHFGKIVSQKELKREHFAPSIFRRTNHTLIGIDKSGDLILTFIRGHTLPEIAYMMKKFGVLELANMDGGSSSSLIFHKHYYGSSRPKVLLMMTPTKK